MRNEDFGLVKRLVVMRSLHQCRVITEFRGALGSLDGFQRRFGAGSGNQFLSLSGGFLYGDENSLHLCLAEQNRFSRRTEHDVARQVRSVVALNVVLEVRKRDGTVVCVRRGKRRENSRNVHGLVS